VDLGAIVATITVEEDNRISGLAAQDFEHVVRRLAPDFIFGTSLQLACLVDAWDAHVESPL
jgi:hypothetical protein